jgi:hypothetical protein
VSSSGMLHRVDLAKNDVSEERRFLQEPHGATSRKMALIRTVVKFDQAHILNNALTFLKKLKLEDKSHKTNYMDDYSYSKNVLWHIEDLTVLTLLVTDLPPQQFSWGIVNFHSNFYLTNCSAL